MAVLRHVAIIMDGNRRWATAHGLPKLIGHTKGAEGAKRVVRRASDRGVQYITLWALSTENVKERNSQEVNHLFSLLENLVQYLGELLDNGVRFRVIGDIDTIPTSAQRTLRDIVERTRENTGIVLTLAINYGGRDEIVRLIKRYIKSGKGVDAATEETVGQYLDTAGMPEPELIIRTGGKQRLSGFLPWQSVYSELYFTDTYWPDFDEAAFDAALSWYEAVERNFGK
jgi:undecaprenyl diphosphate synthase